MIDNCPAQVIGRVMDINGNPIVNANVKLYADANTNGLPDTTVAIRNVFTSSLGGYNMANLIPGHYVIVQTQPVGWLSFDDGDNSNDSDVVGNMDSLDNIIPVSLPVLEVDSMNIFIEIPAPGGISGNVFDDFNQNMTPDPGEGIANVTVSLFNDTDLDGQADTGVPHAVTTTTGNGFYSFVTIPVGSYVLVETQPNDYNSVQDFDPSADGDLVPNTNMTNDTLPVTLSNGETDAHNFFIDGTQCNLIVSNPNDDGYGSLRSAIECAQDGDTIRFHSSLTGLMIEITSGELVIDDDVVIMSTLSPRVNIASGVNGLFEIAPNTNVEFINLDMESGLGVPGEGAAFQNFGVLKLDDVAIKRNPALNQDAYLVKNHSLSDMTLSGDCEFLFN